MISKRIPKLCFNKYKVILIELKMHKVGITFIFGTLIFIMLTFLSIFQATNKFPGNVGLIFINLFGAFFTMYLFQKKIFLFWNEWYCEIFKIIFVIVVATFVLFNIGTYDYVLYNIENMNSLEGQGQWDILLSCVAEGFKVVTGRLEKEEIIFAFLWWYGGLKSFRNYF